MHTGIESYLNPACAITGSFLTTPTEGEVVTGTQTIILTLGQGRWVAAGTKFNAQRQAIINSLDSNKAESTGWDTKVIGTLVVGDVVRTSDSVVTITLPAVPDYNISADEVITAIVPRTAIEGYPGTPANATTWTIANATPTVSAALTGTFLTTPTESEVITGGQTIIITLTGGSWVTGAAFTAQRTAIIAGLTSAGAGANGWNARVKTALAAGDVVRTSGSIVTVTLPAVANYGITGNETVTVTVPRLAIQGADAAVVATPTIPIVQAPTITAALTGTLLATPTEAQVIAGGTIIITLTLGTWVAAGATFNAVRAAIAAGITSAGAEATGWNTKVRDVFAVGDVVRTDDTICTVTVAATPTYNISANETVTVTIPRTAIVEADAAVVATETLVVANATPVITAALTGTFLTTPTTGEVAAGGQTIIATLTGGTWIPAGAASFDTVRQSIINGLTSDGAAPAGWNALVKTTLAVGDVVRTANDVVTITLPAVPTYAISAAETVTMTIPRLALAQADAAVVAGDTMAIAPVTAAITGTMQAGGVLESEIVTGGQTIIITLTGGSWVAAGANFSAQRQNIIDGVTSDGAEATGWNALVKPTIAQVAVVRTSASVVTITLPAVAGYSITSAETVTVTVPVTAILAGASAAVVGAPTLPITEGS